MCLDESTKRHTFSSWLLFIDGLKKKKTYFNCYPLRNIHINVESMVDSLRHTNLVAFARCGHEWKIACGKRKADVVHTESMLQKWCGQFGQNCTCNVYRHRLPDILQHFIVPGGGVVLFFNVTMAVHCIHVCRIIPYYTRNLVLFIDKTKRSVSLAFCRYFDMIVFLVLQCFI